MNDRELLELAAKAAGIDLEWFDGSNNETADAAIHNGEYWNPLIDDGDALRLAVKLRIIITFTSAAGPGVSAGQRMGPFSNERLPDRIFGLHEDCAATRRAIVRAAAEIGKAMP